MNEKIIVIFKETGFKDAEVQIAFTSLGVKIEVIKQGKNLASALSLFFAANMRTAIKKCAHDMGAKCVETTEEKVGRA